MRITCFLLLSIFFVSCYDREKDAPKNPKKLVGGLVEEEGVLYVDPEHKKKVLEALDVEEVESETGEKTYKYTPPSIVDTPFSFTLDTTDIAKLFLAQDIFLANPIKIWAYAECTDSLPGFFSDCMGTFGKHRDRGNFMNWQVDTWYTCADGEGYCIEHLRDIGNIFYYQIPGCQQLTVTDFEPIRRFTCKIVF